MKLFYVYIMASRMDGALYIGITSDLIKRVWQHKEGITESHTKKYAINQLVYFETYEEPEPAIIREKQMKAWKRAWKIELIEKHNPLWKDLYEEIIA